MEIGGEDVCFEAAGINVAGLAWGPADGRPVLALHGWLDNAGSFSVLAPMLEGCRVVALDAPGHGLSEPHSEDAHYNIWEDLPQVEAVLDALGWDRATLMGHSRGGIQSTLAAAAMPERVERLILLDGILGRPVEPETAARQLAMFLRDRRRHSERPDRVFASVDEFVSRRLSYGMVAPSARRIAVRGLEKIEGGYRLRGDPRLQGASAVKFSQVQQRAILRAIPCPSLVVWAEEGMRNRVIWDDPTPPEEIIGDVRVVHLPGNHHFHLDPEFAPALATEILRFFA